jgi:nitrite reductase (NADH) large subunit
MAVSGCVRECAEAQCKDVGLVATEKGYNLYVCGNGGAKPRHADLLVADVDEELAITYIDRFLMYYIYTADRLTRTATWLEKLADRGGIDYVRQVVVEDKLGIADELERRMQHLVYTYRCEWKEVVNDPEKRRLFRQFINTDETEPTIDLVDERGQLRPADWPRLSEIGGQRSEVRGAGSVLSEKGSGFRVQSSVVSGQSSVAKKPEATDHGTRTTDHTRDQWICVGSEDDFPKDGGAAIKYGQVQIAVFNFTSRGKWYACQNMCPHKNAFVLSRGIIGTSGEEPKVACPLHKKPYSLETGRCLSGEDYSLKVFPVKVEGGDVFVQLPPQRQLDALLATELHVIRSCDAQQTNQGCTACLTA